MGELTTERAFAMTIPALRCPHWSCRFFTDSIEELEGHVRVKHLKRRHSDAAHDDETTAAMWKCPNCDFFSPFRSDLDIHLKTDHNPATSADVEQENVSNNIPPKVEQD